MARSRQKQRQDGRQKDLAPKLAPIEPKSPNQQLYFDSIRDNIITFVTGPAGSGKSFIAFWHGLKYLLEQKISKIIIVRPLVAVNNFGESKNLGAVPGGIIEKLLPWLAGILDNAELLIDRRKLEMLLGGGSIEFMPLALCRGRSFHNALILIEEAQNISLDGDGLKMLLTRIGENSKCIIAGDIQQKDLHKTSISALADAMDRFKNTKDIGIIELERADIIRSEIVKTILDKYEQIN